MAAQAAGAVGSIAGAAISGKGAKKAAKIQAQTTAKVMDQVRQYQNEANVRYAPEMQNGNAAGTIYNGLLGIGDQAQAANALSTWKGSVGYQDQLNDTLAATNSSAYANGMGRSGATYKALQDNASKLNSNYLQTYLGNLDRSVQTGMAAKGAVTGVSTNGLATSSATTQAQGTASANSAISQANSWANVANQLGALGSDALGSSFKK